MMIITSWQDGIAITQFIQSIWHKSQEAQAKCMAEHIFDECSVIDVPHAHCALYAHNVLTYAADGEFHFDFPSTDRLEITHIYLKML